MGCPHNITIQADRMFRPRHLGQAPRLPANAPARLFIIVINPVKPARHNLENPKNGLNITFITMKPT